MRPLSLLGLLAALSCGGEDRPQTERVEPPTAAQTDTPAPPPTTPPASAGGTRAERIAALRDHGCPALDAVAPVDRDGPRTVALLVGVGAYQLDSVTDLRGPAWDVARMYGVLTDRFGVEPADVCVLLDEDATHARFEAAWEQALVQRVTPGDEAVFFFAGHGSQARDWDADGFDEPDGRDETLMLHDSRVARPDLLDDELNGLLARVHARSGKVAVFLDACNSGSATRGLDDELLVRQHVLLDAEPPDGFEPGQGGDYAPADLPGLVAFTAALDGTSALEQRGAGIFTTALVEALAESEPGEPLTYAALGARISRSVRSSASPQIPTAEGDLQRGAFGGQGALAAGLQVTAVEGEALTLAGIPTGGWSAGSTLALVADGASPDAPPRGEARLDRVDGFSATATLTSGAASTGDRALLLASSKGPVAVAVSAAVSAAQRAALEQALADMEAAASVALADSGALGVDVVDGQLAVLGPEGSVRRSSPDPDEIARVLANLVRQGHLLVLRGGGTLPEGALQLRVVASASKPQDRCPMTELHPGPWGGAQRVPICTRIELQARLSDTLPADTRLYVGGVVMTNDGELVPVPSAGRALEPLRPGDDPASLVGFTARPPLGSEDGALIFATTQPVDWSRLAAGAQARGAPTNPIEAALRDALGGARSRGPIGGARAQGASGEAWTSAYVPIRPVAVAESWTASERADPGVCTARKARFAGDCPLPVASLGEPPTPTAPSRPLAEPPLLPQPAPRAAAPEPDMSLTAAAFLASIATVEAGTFQVDCVRGCQPGGDETPDLLYRLDEDDPVTLRFTTGAPEDGASPWRYRLYAANPKTAGRLRDRGLLDLQRVEGMDVLSTDVRVSPRDLGTGTFIAAVVRENKRGRKREIVEWRAFRLLTPDLAALQSSPPSPSTKWELDVRPWVMRANTPNGPLPRTMSEATTWWSLAQEESYTDLDLDGAGSGVPGLGIVLTQPWPAGTGEGVDESSWRDDIGDAVSGGVDGHQVRFEGMQWVEQPNRQVNLQSPEGDNVEIKLAHYYLPITLHTAADAIPLQVSSVGKRGGKKTHWAHETSADLKPPDHPRFWSSYSERDFSKDTDLLKLLGKQVKKGNTPPGLRTFTTQDGDGGTPDYEVGFYLQLSPWLPGPEDGVIDAGIVSVDVVAARRGIGAPTTRGSDGRGELGQVLSDVVGHDGKERSLDLDAPPEGYFIAEGFAKLGTNVGTLRLLGDDLATAQRGVEGLDAVAAGDALPSPVPFPLDTAPDADLQARSADEPLLAFPDAVRFSLGAQLRAGALMQEGGVLGNRRSAKRMVPIDSYAQYILKVTVAMAVEQELVVNEEALIVTEAQLTAETNIVEKPPGAVDRVADAVGIPKWMIFAGAGVAVLIALLVMVPGLGPAIGNFLKAGSSLAAKGAEQAPAPPKGRAPRPGGGGADDDGGSLLDRLGDAAVGAAERATSGSSGAGVAGLGDEDGVIITIKGSVPGRIVADIRMDEGEDEDEDQQG